MIAERGERKMKLERLLHKIELPTKDGSLTVCITQEEKLGSRYAMGALLSKDVLFNHDGCRKEMKLERLSETQQKLTCPDCNLGVRFSTNIRTVGELDKEFDKRRAGRLESENN